MGRISKAYEARFRALLLRLRARRLEPGVAWLVRDAGNGKVVIADGCHRLCAVYSFDEDALIPCKIE